MASLAALLAEAQSKGYTSPLPDVLAAATAAPLPLEELPPTELTHHFQALEEGWAPALEKLLATGALQALLRALAEYSGEIRAPLPSTALRPLLELPLRRVRVVLLSQDPYPGADRSRTTLEAANRLPHHTLAESLGPEYSTWELARPAPLPQPRPPAEGPPVRLGAVPYATGRPFAYPAVCTDPPAAYQNLRRAVANSYPGRRLAMDPELRNWSEQGVLLLHSCPLLYGHRTNDDHFLAQSGKTPHMWSAVTAIILNTIVEHHPYCVFVLIGNGAATYKRDIIATNPDACILETGHPTSRQGTKDSFLDSGIFRRINEFFETVSRETGERLEPIRW